ncbi:lipocalin family protein [Pedobacter heparinus]|uniref:lipocalin family protein n=1 Tax=Pedobacter heparinus TaxID=984 RepID=UPI00292D02AC|nr:lipocalin family protein [Pedobacter heparinus]
MKNNVNPLFFYLLIMAVTMLTLACSPSGANDSKQSGSFTNKSWKLYSLSVAPAIDWDLDGKKETDILATMEGCEKDDLLLLRNDSTIVRNAGKLKCDEDDEQEKHTGSWTYDKASKKLTLNEDNDAQVLTVVESSGSRLVVTYNWKATNGTSHQMTAIYN